MLALARALPDVGVAARLWRPWEDPLAEASCLHLFGTAEEFLPVVEAARQQHVPVVLSPSARLAEADHADEAARRQPLARKVTAWAGYVGRSFCPRWPSRRRQLYQSVDLLLPNSNAEAQQIIRQYQVPGPRVHVVPHGADMRLALADPEPFAARVGMRDFVLHVGPIEPRNNQLGFLLAMRGEELPIVLLGDTVAGYEWYEAECRRAAGEQVHFVPRIAAGDPLLASAYAGSGCLVVASGVAAPERIALEGGMSGTPLVLFQDSPAYEYFGHQAVYVKPDDLRAIRRGVLAALARKRSPSLAEHVRTYFSWNAVAQVTREAYGRVIRR
jgi:glycosyltransferase involved in cell wall biosynthesis